MNNVQRKEVHLDKDAIKRLQELADKRKWSLKKYMEYVLVKESGKLIKAVK
jgi:hypothetical protein